MSVFRKMIDVLFYVGGSYVTITIGEHGQHIGAFVMALCIGNMMQIEIQKHLR